MHTHLLRTFTVSLCCSFYALRVLYDPGGGVVKWSVISKLQNYKKRWYNPGSFPGSWRITSKYSGAMS
jgi:hypothetical protein